MRRRDEVAFGVSGVFPDLFPAGFAVLPEPCFRFWFRDVSAGVFCFAVGPEVCFRSCLRAVSAALSVGWIGVPGAGRVPRLRREREAG